VTERRRLVGRRPGRVGGRCLAGTAGCREQGRGAASAPGERFFLDIFALRPRWSMRYGPPSRRIQGELFGHLETRLTATRGLRSGAFWDGERSARNDGRREPPSFGRRSGLGRFDSSPEQQGQFVAVATGRARSTGDSAHAHSGLAEDGASGRTSLWPSQGGDSRRAAWY